MSKKSLIDRIPWFRATGADSKTDDGQGQEQDQKPDVADTQQPGEQTPETGPEETMTMEQLVEQVRAGILDEVRATMTPLIEVVQEMDAYIRTHDEALAHLVQDDAKKVKGLMEGEEWYKSLYIRSQDADAETPDADVPPQGKGGQVRELDADETPSSVIFGHGSRD